MTTLLEKLILGGYAKNQIINFSLQEMILPQSRGTTRIIYEWSQYWRDNDGLSDEEYDAYIQLLCTVQDPGQNLHFVTTGRWTPNVADTTESVGSWRDDHNFLFYSDSDICLTWGTFRREGADVLLNPGTIPYNFNRPKGLNNSIVPRTLQRTILPAPNEYDYRPTNIYKDEMGYDTGFNPVGLSGNNITAVVKYLDVNLPLDQLQSLVLTL